MPKEHWSICPDYNGYKQRRFLWHHPDFEGKAGIVLLAPQVSNNILKGMLPPVSNQHSLLATRHLSISVLQCGSRSSQLFARICALGRSCAPDQC